MANDNFEEEKTLPRTVGSAEDTQHVCNYENKNNEILNDTMSAIVTPIRDSRNNRRKFELLQFEEKNIRSTLKITS